MVEEFRLGARAHPLALGSLSTEIHRRRVGGYGEEGSVAGAHAKRPQAALGRHVWRRAVVANVPLVVVEGVGVATGLGIQAWVRRSVIGWPTIKAALRIERCHDTIPPVGGFGATACEHTIAVLRDHVSFGFRLRQCIRDITADLRIGISIDNHATG